MLIFHGSSITFSLPSVFSPFFLLSLHFCFWNPSSVRIHDGEVPRIRPSSSAWGSPFICSQFTQHRTWLHSKTCNMEMRTQKKQKFTFEQVANTAGKKVERGNERQVHLTRGGNMPSNAFVLCISFFIYELLSLMKKVFSISSNGTLTWLKCTRLCCCAIFTTAFQWFPPPFLSYIYHKVQHISDPTFSKITWQKL